MKVKLTDILSYLKENDLVENAIKDQVQDIDIDGYSQIDNPLPNTITWIKKGRKLSESECAALGHIVIITDSIRQISKDARFIVSPEPKVAFFSVVRHFFYNEKSRVISSTSVVETSKIGNEVGIGHFSYIGPNVEIGDDVTIGNNVSIECPCKIGAHSRIGSGTVIGNDGYGYYRDREGVQQRVPHTGGVIIGKYVEIDANVCIDRGTIGDTIIGDYVKIDNFVQVAHNDVIAPHAMLLGHSAIAGSVRVGERAYVAPGALIMNQKKVGANAVIGAGSVVIGNIKDGMVVSGNPAEVLWDSN